MVRNTVMGAWVEEDLEHIVHAYVPVDQYAQKGGIIITDAHGIIVRGADGREYLDFNAGVFNVNIGYSRKELAEAAMAQMAKMPYVTAYAWFASATTVEFAHKLAEVTPEGINRFLFTCGGSEGNETAFKLARLPYLGNDF